MKPIVILIGLAALSFKILCADEGRIPIFQPTTITQPGHYVVTRNISAPGTVIRIATDDVVLDLNGHRLVGPVTSPSCPSDPNVIHIDNEAGARDVVIRNGHLMNGCHGIAAFNVAPPRFRISLEGLEIEGSAIHGITIGPAETADVIGCYIHDIGGFGILVNGQTASFGGRILSNKIERVSGSGIWLEGLYNGEVRGNVVSDYGSFGPGMAGIALFGLAAWRSGGNLVAGNTASSFPTGSDDDGIYISTPHNYLLGNVVRGNGRHGIWSAADGNRLEGNVASGNGFHGLQIGNGDQGLRNHLDRNHSQDNSQCGVLFSNGGTHAYSNNNVRGNAVGGFCGPANTDAGGNIL